MKLNQPSYDKLIAEDLQWLCSLPRTLERDHVIQIVEASSEHEYHECPGLAGHLADCDVFEPAPDFGPSRKPCNCRRGRE